MQTNMLVAVAVVASLMPLCALARPEVTGATVLQPGRRLLQDAVYPHPNPQGATYKGCYRTGADLALLPAWLFVTSYHLGDYPFDYQKCVDIARSMGFKYAGFNYGTRCLAGMDESLFNGKEISDSYCTTPCDFTSAQRGEQMYGCGGNYAISIYEVAPRDCSNIVPSSRDYSPPILQYYDVYVKDNAVYYTNATNNGVVSDGRVAGLVFGFMQAWDLGTGTTVILTSSMQCSVTTPDGVVHPYTAGGPIVWSPQGINKYTCTVTDAAGNTATKTITANIQPATGVASTSTTQP